MYIPKNLQSSSGDIKKKIDKVDIQYMVCDEKTISGAHKLKVAGFYILGNLSLLTVSRLGIVGPRKMSDYGKNIIDHTIHYIKGMGIVTVSGGAGGVDTYVHELSLQHKIPTIMVLAGGIEWYMNSTKYSLCQKILETGGLLVSEYDVSMAPQKYTFPQRNRVIALLSDLVMIPEAGAKSGSLITAGFATKIGKPVYGAPQDIFREQGYGVNQYIANGKIKTFATIPDLMQKAFPLIPRVNMSEGMRSTYAHTASADPVSLSLQELGLL